MLKDYFYNQTIKKIVAVFGTLFNDISIMRTNADDASIVRVPLAYGPKQKFLARIDEENNLMEESKVGIRLPRMSFEITSITYDQEAKLSRMNKALVESGSNNFKLGSYAPYRIGLQLNILSKTQNDGLQILEQILPYFQPEYTVTINSFSEFQDKADVPFVLTGITTQDDYESDFLSRRAIIYTLDFETRVRFYGPSADNAKVIKEVIVDYHSEPIPDGKFKVQTVTATGTSTNYTITETIEVDFD